MKTTKEERDHLRSLLKQAFSGAYSVSIPNGRGKVAAKLHACNGRLREVAHFFIDEAQALYFAALPPEFVERLLDDLDAKESGGEGLVKVEVVHAVGDRSVVLSAQVPSEASAEDIERIATALRNSEKGLKKPIRGADEETE